MGNALRLIAETRGEAFYRGELAEKMATSAGRYGSALSVEDLASHEPFWCETVSKSYHSVEAQEIPPNGQGIAALIALGILERTPVRDQGVDSVAGLHLQIEAMKLALAEIYAHVGDPESMAIEPTQMLKPDYLEARAREIDPKRARDPGHVIPRPGGTVYIAAADASGMMVSFIQSNYQGFGSGVVVPDTGISL